MYAGHLQGSEAGIMKYLQLSAELWIDIDGRHVALPERPRVDGRISRDGPGRSRTLDSQSERVVMEHAETKRGETAGAASNAAPN